MRIGIVTPAAPGSLHGNRVTAGRWAGILRQLGHRVTLTQCYNGGEYDLLVALHARRSFQSIARFRQSYPDRPLLVTLTGTDVYSDLGKSGEAQESLRLATRIITLQPLAAHELEPDLRNKAVTLIQSVQPPRTRSAPSSRHFDVCVLGHLRPVKDPFRAAEAARHLPSSSRVRILHAGRALEPEMEQRARREMAANPRYRWLGELPRWRALRLLGGSRLMALTSLMEGGANVVSEALALSVPILSSRIAGSVGILGEDYPGYFPTGDTAALAHLLRRAEMDAGYYSQLLQRCENLKALVDPQRESAAWRDLLRSLGS